MSSSAALRAVEEESIDAVALGRTASALLEKLLAEATSAVRARVVEGGRLSSKLLDAEQRATHGLAWLATYVFGVRELVHYADRLGEMGRFGETEKLLVQIGIGEYLAQILGGIPMSQGELVRLEDMYVAPETSAELRADPAVAALLKGGNTSAARAALAAIIRQGHSTTVGDAGLDETMEAMRSEMRRFRRGGSGTHAHEWHLKNAYIPMEIIQGLADMGVFGLTIP